MSSYVLYLADNKAAHVLISIAQVEQEAMWNALTNGYGPDESITMAIVQLLRFRNEHKNVTVYRFDSDESYVKLNEALTQDLAVIDNVVAVGKVLFRFGDGS